jgi:hypothetical protein
VAVSKILHAFLASLTPVPGHNLQSI